MKKKYEEQRGSLLKLKEESMQKDHQIAQSIAKMRKLKE